jgi:hypothetical protein
MQHPLNDGIYVVSRETFKKGLLVDHGISLITELYKNDETIGQIIDDLLEKRHNLSIDEYKK